MRRKRDILTLGRFVALPLIVYCGLSPSDAHACSLAPDYKIPTNFELAREADVILVGTVVKSIEKDGPVYHNLLVKPSMLLKGPKLPDAVFIHGMLAGQIIEDGGKRFRVQSKDSQPLDLWRPHPDGGVGSCSRYTFKKGNQLLLFFKRRGDELEWLDPPYARGSEDVSGPDALWVKAVKIYAETSLLPVEKQRPELIRQMKILRDRKNELLADDIERQLDGVTAMPVFYEDEKTNKWMRWQNNIYDSIFYDVPQPIEVKNEAVRAKTNWKMIALFLGLLNLLCLLIIFVLLRKLKATAK